MPYQHTDCGGLVESTHHDERDHPDPDRWGNLRFLYVCERCDERFTFLWAADVRSMVPPETVTEIDDRGTPPEHVTKPSAADAMDECGSPYSRSDPRDPN